MMPHFDVPAGHRKHAKRMRSAMTDAELKLACSSEGSGPEDDYKDGAELSGDAQSGFMVMFKDGGNWGPMKLC